MLFKIENYIVGTINFLKSDKVSHIKIDRIVTSAKNDVRRFEMIGLQSYSSPLFTHDIDTFSSKAFNLLDIDFCLGGWKLDYCLIIIASSDKSIYKD